jgi:hypothetical protein
MVVCERAKSAKSVRGIIATGDATAFGFTRGQDAHAMSQLTC